MDEDDSDLHIYIPVTPGRQVHIHFEPEPATIFAEATNEFEAMLASLVRAGGPNIQAAYDGAIQLGYVAELAEPEDPDRPRPKYLRMHDPAVAGTASAFYLTPSNFDFATKAYRERVAGMPGAIEKTRSVLFRLETAEGVQRALAAAKAVKG
jgi:hypothetical protein